MFYLLKKFAREYAKKRRIAEKLGDNYIVRNEIKENGFNMQYVVSKHDQKLRAFIDIDEEEVVIPFKKDLSFHEYRYYIIYEVIYIALDKRIYWRCRRSHGFSPLLAISDLSKLYYINNYFIFYKNIEGENVVYNMATTEKINIHSMVCKTPLIFEKKESDRYRYIIATDDGKFCETPIFCDEFYNTFFTKKIYQINKIGNKYWVFQYNGRDAINKLDDIGKRQEFDTVKQIKVAEYFNYIAISKEKSFLLKVDQEFDMQEIQGTAIAPLDSKESEYKDYYKIYDKNKVHLAFFSENTKRIYIIATYEGADIKLSNKSHFNELGGQFERKLIVIKEEDATSIKTNNE